MTSRDDLTLVVRHPDFLRGEPGEGKFLAVHADGTRVCMDPDAGCAWRVEREGTASVHAPRGGGALAVDLGDAAAAAEENGVVVVVAPDGGAIAADEDGRVAFCPGTVHDAAEVAKAALAGDAFGAFVFDLERRALRFDDGTTPSREEEAHAADGDASEARIDGDASEVRISSVEASRVSIASKEETRASEPEPTPGAFVVHDGKFLSLRQFEDLDPPPPPEDEDDENGEDDAKEDENVAEENENAEEENAEEGNAEKRRGGGKRRGGARRLRRLRRLRLRRIGCRSSAAHTDRRAVRLPAHVRGVPRPGVLLRGALRARV